MLIESKDMQYLIQQEVNSKYHSGSDLNEIYEAFMRGVNRFVDEYNKNNIIPISIVCYWENT